MELSNPISVDVSRDYHGLLVPVSSVYNRVDVLHHVLGASLSAEVVNDEKVLAENPFEATLSLLAGQLHERGDGADVGMQNREAPLNESVGDGGGHVRLASAHLTEQQESVGVSPLEGVGIAFARSGHLRVLLVVCLEGAASQSRCGLEAPLPHTSYTLSLFLGALTLLALPRFPLLARAHNAHHHGFVAEGVRDTLLLGRPAGAPPPAWPVGPAGPQG